MKFRKKPVIVDAVQWFKHGDHPAVYLGSRDGHPLLATASYISMPGGELHVSPGDWIITGIMGEYYPCKPDAFSMLYEKVDD